MLKVMKLGLYGLSMLGLFVQPAQACWDAKASDAAKVMHLNNMMMVSALRCRHGSDNFLTDYNRFIKMNKVLINAQHRNAKQHFIRKHGAKKATNAMDRFNISLANKYGAGHPAMECGELKQLAKNLAKKQSAASLMQYANDAAGLPALPGGTCNSRIAAFKQ